MENLQKVVQRIAAIEQRFARINVTPAGKFSDILAGIEAQPDNAGSGRARNIENLVIAAARKHGVDPKLALAVAAAESNLEPQAVSSAGAVGVMQLMPGTAKSLGVLNIHDPRENIDAGVRYLKQMLATFGGNAPKAVAAYNAGPAAVEKYGGVPPYKETRAYVDKVIALSR